MTAAVRKATWLEQWRQHERTTNAVRQLQDRIESLLIEGGKPSVDHYLGGSAGIRQPE